MSDLPSALSFYRDRLGFEITFQAPAAEPFFGIVQRGRAMIMLKDVGVHLLPNYKREPAARWDAYVDVSDPDALAVEFGSRNVEFSEPLRGPTAIPVIRSQGMSPLPNDGNRRQAH